LSEQGWNNIERAFDACKRTVSGESGVLEYWKNVEAYKDPVYEKSLFLLSITANSCKRKVNDRDKLLSPVDYHELRGHLRIGTVRPENKELEFKLEHGLSITELRIQNCVFQCKKLIVH